MSREYVPFAAVGGHVVGVMKSEKGGLFARKLSPTRVVPADRLFQTFDDVPVLPSGDKCLGVYDRVYVCITRAVERVYDIYFKECSNSIQAVVAHDEEFGIGINGSLAWHIPEDLKFFKSITENTAVIMGMTTWNSLPEKFRPLPRRLNIVLTRSVEGTEFRDGAIFTNSRASALSKGLMHGNVSIIGGAEIYALFQRDVDVIYATQVTGKFGCDKFLFDYAREFRVEKELSSSDAFKILEFRRRTE